MSVNYLCFDVGGSFTKYGTINSEGEILRSSKVKTPKVNCRETIPRMILEVTEGLSKEAYFSAIGISTAGQVDPQKGTIIYANENLPDYTGCQLAGIIERASGINTFVENDGNCAVLGELWKGAGRSYSYFVCLTLGTGVGGAVIFNKKLLAGAHSAAAELGRLHSSSNILTSETVLDKTASTSSLLTRYHKLAGVSITGEELMGKVKSSDSTAKQAYDDFMESLVIALADITFCFDPEAIIIGGGISSQGDFFFDRVNQLYHQKAMPAHKTIKILKAELENSAGLLGAAYICRNRNYLN